MFLIFNFACMWAMYVLGKISNQVANENEIKKLQKDLEFFKTGRR